MGTRIYNIVENIAYQGFEIAVIYLNKEIDNETIKEMFAKSVSRKRIPLQKMGKKRAVDILLMGFCAALEGSNIAFYTQCKIFNELTGLNYDEDELNSMHMQSVRLYAWKNQLK